MVLLLQPLTVGEAEEGSPKAELERWSWVFCLPGEAVVAVGRFGASKRTLRMAAAAAESDNPSTYFRRVNLYVMVVVAIGLAFHSWAFFSPETFPYGYLGPLGTFTKYVQTNHNTLFQLSWYGAWGGHMSEALISFLMFEAKGITDRATQLKWTLQTLSFGILSFGFLLLYNPPKKHR